MAREAFNAALEVFYRAHNPNGLHLLTKNLERNKGKEIKMLELLEERYKALIPVYVYSLANLLQMGPDGKNWMNTLEIAFMAALAEFYQNQNPANIGKIYENRMKYKGKEEELLSTLEVKYETKIPTCVHQIADILTKLIANSCDISVMRSGQLGYVTVVETSDEHPPSETDGEQEAGSALDTEGYSNHTVDLFPLVTAGGMAVSTKSGLNLRTQFQSTKLGASSKFSISEEEQEEAREIKKSKRSAERKKERSEARMRKEAVMYGPNIRPFSVNEISDRFGPVRDLLRDLKCNPSGQNRDKEDRDKEYLAEKEKKKNAEQKPTKSSKNLQKSRSNFFSFSIGKKVN